MDEIKDRLKKALDERNMTAADLARKSGLNKGAISKYLSGFVVPKQSAVGVMSKALDVSPAWLLGYEVNERGELLQPVIQINKLNDENKAKLLGYYQALLDAQKED